MRLLSAPGALCLAASALLSGCGGNEFVTEDAGPTGTPETGTPTDAGPSWCASNTTTSTVFCEDFDEYPSGAAGISALLSSTTWPTFEQSGGTFSFDTSNPPSPPNAFVATGGSNAQMLIVKGLATPGASITTLHLEFDLRINEAGTVGLLSAAGLAAIAFGDSLADGYAALAIGSGPNLTAVWTLPADAGAANANSFKTQNATGSFPTTGQWSGRYAIEIDYTGTAAAKTGCIQIYQGVTPLLSPCLALPAEFVTPHALSVALGDYAGGGGNTGTVDIEFDNVTFTEK
ncbi:MAG: hypothetical protein ACLQVI_24075 [Polyangiaceae bacterium]